MTGLRMTADVRNTVLQGYVDLQTLLDRREEDWPECEVIRCENLGTMEWEVNDDEVRNFCIKHWTCFDRVTFGDLEGILQVTVRCDDDSIMRFGFLEGA